MMGQHRQFQSDAAAAAGDAGQRQRIRNSMRNYSAARAGRIARYQDWQTARSAASAVKHEAIGLLDEHLREFIRNTEARGTKVHFAADAAEARGFVLDIVARREAKLVVKSKTMTSEEIHLNEALAAAGCEVVESDLGEYIVQLLKQPPFHFVFPAMHLDRAQVQDIFQRELKLRCSNDPQELTMIARSVLRQVYGRADIGISGANFAIAETGMISITENEGNARLTTSLPPVHIALVGIEKVLPKLSDLALFLPMLATSGTGQALTCYNSMIGGPRQAGEVDGPEEFHVILLDNGRTTLLADAEQRDALHCIRCGACLNVCPVFNTVGGFTYGTTYQGPIGAVITPHLRGLKQWGHLSHASSLCGACTDICPVKIDLHHHLLHNRRNQAKRHFKPMDAMMYRIMAILFTTPWLFGLVGRLGRWSQPLRDLFEGSILDPMRQWTRYRAAPKVAKRSFRQLWKERGRHRG